MFSRQETNNFDIYLIEKVWFCWLLPSQKKFHVQKYIFKIHKILFFIDLPLLFLYRTHDKINKTVHTQLRIRSAWAFNNSGHQFILLG